MKQAIILASLWGTIWAAFLQYTKFGQFLAAKRTWITVVIGVGVDLLILLKVLPRREWVKVFSVVAFSSLSIITRSLHNELHEMLRDINAVKNSYCK